MPKHKVELIKLSKKRNEEADFVYDIRVRVDGVELQVKGVLAWKSFNGRIEAKTLSNMLIVRLTFDKEVKKHPDFLAIKEEVRELVSETLKSLTNAQLAAKNDYQ